MRLKIFFPVRVRLLHHLTMAHLLAFACLAAHSQLPSVTDLTSLPVPGSGHSYVRMLSETVVPANGSLSVEIDLPVPPSRGFHIPFSLRYNSNGSQQAVPLNYQGLYWTGTFPLGGWAYGLPWASRTEQIELSLVTNYTCKTSDNYTFYDARGGQHILHVGELSPTTGTGPGNPCPSQSQSKLSGSDGQVSAYLQPPVGTAYAQGLDVSDQDGTIYHFPKSNFLASFSLAFQGTSTYNSFAAPSSVEDRNGNLITINTTNRSDASGYQYLDSFNVTDAAGRTVISIPNATPYQDHTSDTIRVGAQTYNVTWTTASSSYPVVPASSDTHCVVGNVGTNAYVVSRIDLPNGTHYQFYYGMDNPDPALQNPYGTLSEIIYPSGAWVKYIWQMSDFLSGTAQWTSRPFITNGGRNVSFTTCSESYGHPVVQSRSQGLPASTTPTLVQSFTYGSNGLGPQQASTAPYGAIIQVASYKTTDVLTNDTVSLGGLRTHYIYNGVLPPQNTVFPKGPYNPDLVPVEHAVVTYDAAGTTPLQTQYKQFDTLDEMTCSFILRDDGQSEGHIYQYQYGQVSDDKEYVFGQVSDPSGTCMMTSPSLSLNPALETSTSYLVINSPQGSSFAKPMTIVVSDASGSFVKETDLSYDSASLSTVSGGLPPNTHDETLYSSSAQGGRGNLTVQTEKCFANCSNIVKTAIYDASGQLTSITNALGTTKLDYTDSTPLSNGVPNAAGNSNAYVTKIMRPPTNGISHVSNYKYNYATGELVEHDDENGQATTYAFNDSLLRLTDIYGPPSAGQPHARYSYADSTNLTTTTIDPVGVTSVITSDALGNTINTQLTSDPAGATTIDIFPDGLGQVVSTSNPYRSSNDPTYGITSYNYDALGRKLLQCQPDNGTPVGACVAGKSYQQWSYSGPNTTFQDENGSLWKKTSDAFGRLMGVVEPGAVNTTYSYDVLGNLLCVDQWGTTAAGTFCTSTLQRNFTYDSLSRLITSTNPETGIVCYGQWNGGKCGNGYDGNGNLLHKTDARGTTVNYSYDALNRLLSKTYTTASGQPSTTPSSCYQYDQSTSPSGTSITNPIGRLTSEWTQIGICPSKRPSSGFLTSRSVLAYDPMGRITSEQQCTPANCTVGSSYQLNYAYDLAGNATLGNNGIGSVSWQPQYDAAGRLQTVMGVTPWSDPQYPTLLFNATTYGPIGLIDWIAGESSSANPALTFHRDYDSRLRMSGQTVTGHH